MKNLRKDDPPVETGSRVPVGRPASSCSWSRWDQAPRRISAKVGGIVDDESESRTSSSTANVQGGQAVVTMNSSMRKRDGAQDVDDALRGPAHPGAGATRSSRRRRPPGAGRAPRRARRSRPC